MGFVVDDLYFVVVWVGEVDLDLLVVWLSYDEYWLVGDVDGVGLFLVVCVEY